MKRDSGQKGRVRRPGRGKTNRLPPPRVNSEKFGRALERLCLPHEQVVLANVLDEHIRKVLWAARGEVSLAAQLLGLHRRSLQRMIQRGKKKLLKKTLAIKKVQKKKPRR